MTAPYQRRRDPQPIGQGWEVAVAVVGGVLLAAGWPLGGLGVAAACSAAVGWSHGTDRSATSSAGCSPVTPAGAPATAWRGVPGPPRCSAVSRSPS